RATDHQAGDEDCDDDEQQHAVHTSADAADDDLTELHVDQGHHATKRCERVMHGVHCAAGGVGGYHREQRRSDYAEAHFLAFHVAASEAHRIDDVVAVRFRPIGQGNAD